MFYNIKHLPTWKSFFWNIALTLIVPFGLYLLFDATGVTHWILDQTRDVGRSFFHTPLFGDFNRSYSFIDHIRIFLYLAFHSGAAHIAACASAHFFIHALKDLHCLVFHKHKKE